MAERIAIMGGEPYAQWIERDGNPQRLFKAYRSKWPDGDAQCVAIGNEFYVLQDGDGMRRVYNVGDYDNEDEWCAQCGTPIDTDGSEYYCPRHRGNELLTDSMAPEYTYPYAFRGGHQFTFGVEIEMGPNCPTILWKT